MLVDTDRAENDDGWSIAQLKQEADKYKIDGCQSQVWLYAEFNEGRIKLKADSDATIVKGLAAILVNIYNDCTPEEILSLPLDYLNKLGINNHLSPTRKNGLNAMLKQILNYALVIKKIYELKNKN
ncbi:MAG: SufE family protein [Gammaproteobacteria bacterium]